jgi:hypothetical protein
MGWLDSLFGGGEKISVSTQVSRAVPDTQITVSSTTGLVQALHSNGEIVDHVLENMIGSIGMKAERMLSYAKNSYTYGVPSSKLVSIADSKPIVIQVIRDEIGSTVTENYFQFGRYNLLHAAWTELVNTHGYDSLSNTLGVLSSSMDTPVYLVDMVAVVVEVTAESLKDGSLEVWGVGANAGVTPMRPSAPQLRTATSYLVGAEAKADYVQVTYTYAEKVSDPVSEVAIPRIKYFTDTFDIDLTAYNPNGGYYQVGYTDETGKRKYWIYQAGSGTYSAIDSAYAVEYDPLGSYFPFLYFRFNKQSEALNSGSAGYITSKKLAKYVGIPYDTTIESINSNPDIKDVEQALMVFAVPATTINPVEQRYLFDYFEQVHFEALARAPKAAKTELLQDLEQLLTVEEVKTITPTAFVITDLRYRMTLEFDSVSRTRKAGNLGEVGTYTSEGHVYRKQVSSSFYDEVMVTNLNLNYLVQGGYTTVASGSSANLLIPLDHSITKDYSILEREALYFRSVHYVFNSLVSRYVKWYQTELFGQLLMVIAVVMAVLTFGASVTALMAQGMTLLTAAAYTLFTMFIQAIVFQLAMKLFVKLVGKDLAFLIAIGAALVGGFKAINAGSLSGAPWAKELLILASGITGGINDQLALDYKGLKSDGDLFTNYFNDSEAKLKSANALLEGSSILSPFVIFGEAPTDYFNRTVHAGNIGTVGIDSVTNYVSMALTLPKLSETLGEEPNA